MADPPLAEHIAVAYRDFPKGHYERISAVTPLAKALTLGQLKFEGPEFKYINALLADDPDFSFDITKAVFRMHRMIHRKKLELEAALLASMSRRGNARRANDRFQQANDEARSAIRKTFSHGERQKAFSARIKKLNSQRGALSKKRQQHEIEGRDKSRPALEKDEMRANSGRSNSGVTRV